MEQDNNDKPPENPKKHEGRPNPIKGKPYEETVREITRKISKGQFGYGYDQAIRDLADKGITVTKGQLMYYRKTFIEPEEYLPSTRTLEALKKRKELIDIVSERIRILKIQKERVNRGIQNERLANKLSGRMGQEVKLYSEILSSLKEDYFELGIISKAAEKVEMSGGLNYLIQEFQTAHAEMMAKAKAAHSAAGEEQTDKSTTGPPGSPASESETSASPSVQPPAQGPPEEKT